MVLISFEKEISFWRIILLMIIMRMLKLLLPSFPMPSAASASSAQHLC
jgi:hypothetical protein